MDFSELNVGRWGLVIGPEARKTRFPQTVGKIEFFFISIDD